MPVYVDEVVDYSLIAKARGLRHSKWCHLTADSEAELHAFAARLGLRRSWFQRPDGPQGYRWHYDITPPKRARAVELGAVEINRRQLADIMRRRREAASQEPVIRCGNDPRTRLTDEDRQAVAEFQQYLKQRKEGAA